MTVFGLINIIFLLFALIDLKFYVVKNNMIILAGVLYIIISFIINNANQKAINNIVSFVLIFIITQAFFISLSIFYDLPCGDCKLIGLYLAILGIDDGLVVLCIGSLLSLLPLSHKTNIVPMAPFFYIGYLIHFFFIKGV